MTDEIKFPACGATLQLGSIIFTCALRDSHSGRHSAEGCQEGHVFFIVWGGDMRLDPAKEPAEEAVLSPT